MTQDQPIADWEHIESGDCQPFADLARRWHEQAHAVLVHSGWPRLADPVTATFLQRLGFCLPDRPRGPGVHLPPIDAVRTALALLFTDTWGAWAVENSDRIARDVLPRAPPGWGV